MRSTAVPAQVTTVEDRIAGNLGMGQIVLLFIPIIFGSLLYAGLPPAMHAAAYKLVALSVLLAVCVTLAVRIKGKIVLFWLITLLRYWARPRHYVYDKRSVHGRQRYQPVPETVETEEALSPAQVRSGAPLTPADLMRLNELVERPGANLVYETRKGGLYVRITEIEPEG